MSYQKKLIDNVSCSRRFHVTFDDGEEAVSEAKLDCPYCGQVIFSEQDHPPVTLARQENLIQTAELSDEILSDCQFSDRFGERTIPKT